MAEMENPTRPGILKRVTTFFSPHATLFTILWILAFSSVFFWRQNVVDRFLVSRSPEKWPDIPEFRPFVFNLVDFGGVGDGVSLNTEAFERAVFAISKLAEKGGGQLNVPAGKWLTAPFNLTSHMTLFLAENAVILGIDVSHPFVSYRITEFVLLFLTSVLVLDMQSYCYEA